MKSKGAIIAVVVGILTSLSVSANINHDSISNHGKNSKNKVLLNLDSLKVIETEAEQPVLEDFFIYHQNEQDNSKLQLTIYGQHLSEPKEEKSFAGLL